MTDRTMDERWANFKNRLHDFFIDHTTFGDTPAEKFPKGKKPEIPLEIRRKSTEQLKQEAEDRAKQNKTITANQKKLDEEIQIKAEEAYKQRHNGRTFAERTSGQQRVPPSGKVYYDSINTDVTKETRANINKNDFGAITNGIRENNPVKNVVINPTPKKETVKKKHKRVTQGSGIVYTPIENKYDKSTRIVRSTPEQRQQSNNAYRQWQAQQRAAYERARASAASRGEGNKLIMNPKAKEDN